MGRVAIVALGTSAHEYMRVAEYCGAKEIFEETWVINGFGHVFACDRVFAMDDIRVQAIRAKAGNEKVKRLVRWLEKDPGPVYTSRPLPDAPQFEAMKHAQRTIELLEKQPPSEQRDKTIETGKWYIETLKIEQELIETGGFKGLVAYPLQDVVRDFGVHPHFNSTVAYAIALAAHERKDMSIFGADFIYPGHPQMVEQGKGCCEFWIGIATQQLNAEGRKLIVDVSLQSSLMDACLNRQMYGYDGLRVVGKLDAKCKPIFVFEDQVLPRAEDVERAYDKEVGKVAA